MAYTFGLYLYLFVARVVAGIGAAWLSPYGLAVNIISAVVLGYLITVGRWQNCCTFSVYRKRKNSPISQWHFNTQCPHWPEADFVQVRFVDVKAGERLCQECIKLESEMFPPERTG